MTGPGGPVAAVQAGQVVGGRFLVGDSVHAGGMSSVYRATDQVDGRAVALKVPRGELERFRLEGEMLAALRSERVVRFVSHDLDSQPPYLAMEWLEGETLQDCLLRGPLSVEAAVGVAQGLAEALTVLHRARIIHRDIKPANAFLVGGRTDRVKLIDLGVARREGAPGLSTHATFAGGSWPYMSPEQAMGGAELGARADVFALGCVLYECLAGVRAYPGDRAAVVRAKVWREPPRLRAVVPSAPAAVEAVLLRLMARDPATRPADGAGAAAALAALAVRQTPGSAP